MAQLMSAQVHFMDDRLALVHVPLDLYPFFLQPILRLLFSEVPPIDDQAASEQGEFPNFPMAVNPGFLNLSITPVECSVICSRKLAEQFFVPQAKKLNHFASTTGNRVSISQEDFIVMQVDGQGLHAGQRVLELTIPLAMAGISIFFISTYFSDYILVPSRSREQVVHALEKRGFKFEITSDAFVSSSHSKYSTFGPTSPRTSPSQRSPPNLNTPPPSTLAELQIRTFGSLRKHNIIPCVDKSLRLVQCAAYHQYGNSDATSASILRPALTTALIIDKPRFLSLTLTSADPSASILLEKRLLPRFSLDTSSGIEPDEESSLLLGSKEDILVPIMLDLRDLSLEATGIVCGVAGRLAAATRRENLDFGRSISSQSGNKRSSFDFGGGRLPFHVRGIATSNSSNSDSIAPGNGVSRSLHNLEPDPDSYADAVEISFLSTARAGTVIVGERELGRAIEALEAESQEP